MPFTEKNEANEIPKQTCPAIDKVLDSFGEIEDMVKEVLAKDPHFCPSCKEHGELLYATVEEIDRYVFSDIHHLEDLRTSNEKLRSIGKYWYKKFNE